VRKTGVDDRIVGREQELASLREFVGESARSRALVLLGGPGIGKTTLWEEAIAEASARGMRVLSTRASGAEATLAFGGLIDFLDGIDLHSLAQLPTPQRQALEVALLRAEPGAPPEGRAIALGLLNTLRELAGAQRLLVGIDDVRWLDDASTIALSYAVRRLNGSGVRFLLTTRPGETSAVEEAVERYRPVRIDVGPLSLGATRLLLAERLDLRLPRRLLRRIVDTSLGNPLFTLELGRELAGKGLPELGGDLPVPDTVEDLIGLRVAGLDHRHRRAVLATALADRMRRSELATIAGTDVLDDVIGVGLLDVNGDVVRVSHPLLAAAARRAAPLRERRALHRELATVVADDELRLRHLALAATGTDAALAGRLAATGAAAHARGAVESAVELAEQALRLTPLDADERVERVLQLAEYLEIAGEPDRVAGLLTRQAGSFPPGPARARAHLLLSSVASHADEVEAQLQQALHESGKHRGLRSRVLSTLATEVAVGRVERVEQCRAWAEEALTLVKEGDAAHDGLVYALAWVRVLQGRSLDDLRTEAPPLSAEPELCRSLDHIGAIQLAFRGRIAAARAVFEGLHGLAEERGEMWTLATLRLQLCELELRAGGWAAAEALLHDWDTTIGITLEPARQRCLALLAAGRGLPDEAKTRAGAAIAAEQAAGLGWSYLDALRARALACLFAADSGGAAESLTTVWEHVRREGVAEPGAFPFAPDLVEALVELGRLDEARAVTSWLSALAVAQEHPWGLVATRRCEGLLCMAENADGAGARMLEEAAEGFAELGLPFDRARTLLVLGRRWRRGRKRAAARQALEAAVAAFGELGSTGWVDASRAELDRVGGAESSSGVLTSAEQRVAALAADGLSNKEIARTLFVTVHTVEVHLSRAYAKLGVRRRGQLALRLSEFGATTD